MYIFVRIGTMLFALVIGNSRFLATLTLLNTRFKVRDYSKAQLDTFFKVGKARCTHGIFFCIIDSFFLINRVLKNNDWTSKINQKNYYFYYTRMFYFKF